MKLPQIDGYAEAVRREEVSRCASYLALPETICGFHLRAMTLQDYCVLQIIDSPLLSAAVPKPEDLVSFLWFMSPDYEKGSRAARRRTNKKAWAYLYPLRLFPSDEKKDDDSKRIGELLKGIYNFLKETFQDRPASGTGGGESASYYCDAAAICGFLASEYGWSEREILQMPMRRIFQYIREITARKSQHPVFFNPSDEIKQRFAEKLNTKN